MAETVKKSRIVSDEDNLEESLLEEFNLRLKNCMSQDNLQEESAQETENLENIIVSHGIYENVTHVTPVKKTNISSEFIQNEKSSYYDEPRKLIPQPEKRQENESNTENIYENVKKTEIRQYANLENPENSQPKITLENDVYEVVGENNYEVINEKPTLNFSLEKSENLAEDGKSSVKDRMFLSTDDASCLLFTQTVTSPMLTPSEENIDFLKGFRQEGNQNTSSENSGENSSKNDATDADVSIGEQMVTDLDEKPFENLEKIEENIYENVTNGTVVQKEAIYENLGIRNGLKEEEIYHEIAEGKIEENGVIYQNIEDLKNDLEETKSVEQSESNSNKKLDGNHINNVDIHKNRESIIEFENLEKDLENMEIKEKSIHLVEDILKESVKIVEKHEMLENIEEISEKSELISEKSEVISENHEVISKIEEKHEIKSDIEEIHENIEKPEENIEKTNEKIEESKSEVKQNYSEFIHHNKIETNQNYHEKYTKLVSENSKNIENREKDTETVPSKIVQNLKSQFSNQVEIVGVTTKREISDVNKLKNLDIMKQINKFEQNESGDHISSTVTESYSETTTFEEHGGTNCEKIAKKKKSKKSRKEEKENISVNESTQSFYNVNVKNLCRSFGDLTKIEKCNNNINIDNNNRKIIQLSERMKSSFNKFDALQKKNVLHIRSSDASGAQEKFSGTQIDTTNCKECSKTVFQMEQIKAERAIWHKNCFRCTECSKQLTVDTYQSHEGKLYCKPHFKSLFAPKAIEDDNETPKPRKHELIITENTPLELPPDVVRASDKPDLGLEELQSLNVKERFQVFEQYQENSQENDNREPVNVKKSPSILSKLARFQAKGMDIGVADDSLNGIPIEESSSEEEVEEEILEGEDADLVRAKKVQKEKPFHFTGMSDVKNRWEKGGEQNSRDERREERKQEIQSIRNRLFMGKQGKMKEMYQQAVMESESTQKSTTEKIDFDAKSIKDRFESGDVSNKSLDKKDEEEEEVYESEISKNSRSLFLELDANAHKPPKISPITPPKLEIKKAREAYLNKTVSTEDTVKSSETVDEIEVKTADIQERFKFFETFKEPQHNRKEFRITPPREGQVKSATPEREVYHDPNVVRSEEFVEDSVIAKERHTATKMLNKFRQMEENLTKEQTPSGPKPLKRFTPPPEPARPESSSEGESGSEEEEEENDQLDNSRLPNDLLEAQKAARAKQLRAKFEKWEANEIKKEQNNGTTVSVVEEFGEEQSQVESTRSLRARFESMRETTTTTSAPKVKVNRFV